MKGGTPRNFMLPGYFLQSKRQAVHVEGYHHSSPEFEWRLNKRGIIRLSGNVILAIICNNCRKFIFFLNNTYLNLVPHTCCGMAGNINMPFLLKTIRLINNRVSNGHGIDGFGQNRHNSSASVIWSSLFALSHRYINIEKLCDEGHDNSRYLAHRSWWRHQMEDFSALLVACAGNSPVTSKFPSQRASSADFDVSLMWIRISC